MELVIVGLILLYCVFIMIRMVVNYGFLVKLIENVIVFFLLKMLDGEEIYVD